MANVTGTSGNDTFTTVGGQDTFDGGAGTDTLIVDYSAATTAVTSSTGGGYYSYSSGATVTSVGATKVERYNITSGSGNDVLTGVWGTESILKSGAGDDILNSQTGVATIDGGSGNDQWIADLSALPGQNITLNSNFSLSDGSSVANVESFRLVLGAGDDKVVSLATPFNDVISGGAGNDTFTTVGGQDTFDGGAGTDTLIVDYSAATTAVTSSTGGGYYSYSSGATVTSVGATSVERYNITSGSGNDVLTGVWGTESILKSGAGDDILNSQKGVATIDGGSGSDQWIADLSALPGQNITLNSNFSLSDGSSVANVESFRLVLGAGDDKVVSLATPFNDVISGGAGNDTFTTVGGQDTFDGGAGVDTLIVDYSAATTAVTSSTGGGYYSYTSGATLTSVGATSVERYNITSGSGNDVLLGAAGADILKGGAGNDQLVGAAGDDELEGGSGNDLLNGQAGADRLVGGEGVDTAVYNGSRSAYLLQNTAAGMTVSSAAEGVDTLASIERLKFSDGTLALDLAGSAGSAAKFLGTVAGKASLQNASLVGQVVSMIDSGASVLQLASLVVDSGALASVAGGSDAVRVSQLLMRNVLGSDGDATILDTLVGALNTGQFTQSSLIVTVMQLELVSVQIDLVGLSQSGLMFTSV